MKLKALFLMLALGLVACSATIDSAAPSAGPEEKNTPDEQKLVVGSGDQPANNNIILRNHAGGDLIRRFTYRPTAAGYLYVEVPLLYYSDCELDNLIDVHTLQRLQNGLVVESVVLTTSNRSQYVTSGSDYILKVDFLNLGKCSYINYNFGATFTVQQLIPKEVANEK